eukprot:6865036-Alexandrium_andersonii.AAC.1
MLVGVATPACPRGLMRQIGARVISRCRASEGRSCCAPGSTGAACPAPAARPASDPGGRSAGRSR